MTERPTPPEPDRPDETVPAADQTAALPQADPAATAPLPPQPAAAQPPAWGPPAAGPGGYPPGGVATASAAGSGGSRGWWGEATSSAGGRAALIAVAVLGSLLLLTGLGLVAALVAGHDGWGRMEHARVYDDDVPGQGNGKGNGKGNGNGLGQRNRGRGNGAEAMPGTPATPLNPGNGLGMGRGAGALGDVLHGEYTTDVTGTPTVMVVQTGQVTAYTAGESLTVESSDGFEATYTLDGGVATTRGGTQLATGVQVRVVAAKEGMKVTRLVVG